MKPDLARVPGCGSGEGRGLSRGSASFRVGSCSQLNLGQDRPDSSIKDRSQLGLEMRDGLLAQDWLLSCLTSQKSGLLRKCPSAA